LIFFTRIFLHAIRNYLTLLHTMA